MTQTSTSAISHDTSYKIVSPIAVYPRSLPSQTSLYNPISMSLLPQIKTIGSVRRPEQPTSSFLKPSSSPPKTSSYVKPTLAHPNKYMTALPPLSPPHTQSRSPTDISAACTSYHTPTAIKSVSASPTTSLLTPPHELPSEMDDRLALTSLIIFSNLIAATTAAFKFGMST